MWSSSDDSQIENHLVGTIESLQIKHTPLKFRMEPEKMGCLSNKVWFSSPFPGLKTSHVVNQ